MPLSPWKKVPPRKHELPYDQSRNPFLREKCGRICPNDQALKMGKPISDPEQKKQKCAWVCDYLCGRNTCSISQRWGDSDGMRKIVWWKHEPIGCVLAIYALEFSFFGKYSRFAAPTHLWREITVHCSSMHLTFLAAPSQIESVF